MTEPRRDLMRWQFDLTWQLFEYHLGRLRAGDFLAEPAPVCWTMRPDGDGWVPDWAETEPDPVPVPTIGWVTWHLGWWWTVTADHLSGREPRRREDVAWPGPGEPAIAWLRDLRTRWLAVLDSLSDADLDGPAPFPFPDSGLTVAHTLGWVNAELMKNVAEIGQLRLVRTVAA
ncbi:DinB family protein [Amycolatopsis suaedae]|uniref:DinB family protein n=1 Tax=Amycolatopsis suaedae TaxID=2510978 RepID=A0A4Q7J7Z0_9PSEU|nr:DinB family protein [Amycolatopsis suaedae]RZQ62483.1 DinB family protein [Amycolatopsis suaedae]